MEKATNICVVTADFHWDDVGSWDSLYDHLPKDNDGVISQGDVLTQGCRDSLIVNQTKQIVTAIGVDNLSVVVTADAILLVPRGRSQQVKNVVDALKAKGRGELL
jgi:mannose-1-phosphate guanylyltransferase